MGLRDRHDRTTDVTEAVEGLWDESVCVVAVGRSCDGHGPS